MSWFWKPSRMEMLIVLSAIVMALVFYPLMGMFDAESR